jgi:TraY domain
VKPPTSGERVPVGFRITAETKTALEAAAIASGRSLSQECELRLTESFERDWILQRLQAWLKKEMKK